MLLHRRDLLLTLGGLLSGTAITVFSTDAAAGPRARHRRRVKRRVRRRVRRRVYRRYRRRVAWRMVGGRRLWVAPVAMAVGWELALAAENGRGPDEIVVVKEIKVVQVSGAPVNVAVVQAPDGTTREVEFVREDTDENRKELPGTVVASNHGGAPAREVEEDAEEEVEEEVEEDG